MNAHGSFRNTSCAQTKRPTLQQVGLDSDRIVCRSAGDYRLSMSRRVAVGAIQAQQHAQHMGEEDVISIR